MKNSRIQLTNTKDLIYYRIVSVQMFQDKKNLLFDMK